MQITLLVVAPIFLVVAIGMSAYENDFLRHSLRAQAFVVQMEEIKSTETESPQSTYAPVFTFRVAGTEHTVHSNSGSNPPAFVVGQSVSILYDPDSPEHAQIASWGQQWGLVFGFGIGAFVTGVLGLWMRIVRGPKRSWDYVPFADGPVDEK